MSKSLLSRPCWIREPSRGSGTGSTARPGLTRLPVCAGLALPAVLFGFVPVSAAGVAAQAPVGQSCDALVTDHSGELSTGELAEIEQAARDFRTDLAYEVRVRVLTQEQAPFLEDWVDGEGAACPSWQNSSGGFRDNLVVLAFTTDNAADTGETLIFYGDRMPAEMDDKWPDIQADTINPALNDGDWTGGITDGLADIGDVVDPSSSNNGYVAAAAAGVGVVGVGGGVVFVRRRKRKALGGRFRKTTGELDTLTLKLDPLTESLRRDIELVRTAVAEEELEEALGTAETMLTSADQFVYQRSELSADRDLLMGQRNLSKIGEGVRAWEMLEKSVRDLLPELEAEGTRMAELLAVREDAPRRLARIETLAAQTREAEAAATADGYVTTTDAAVLGVVGEQVAMIERHLAERRLIAVDAASTRLIADLERARSALGRMAQREVELGERVVELEQAQADVTTLTHTAADADTTLRDAFAQSVFAAIDGNVETGRRETARAGELISGAREALESRDLGAAEARLNEAQAAQAAAQSQFTSVTERLELAQRLQQSVPGRRSTVASKVGNLQDLVTRLGSAATAGLRQQVSELESRVGAVDVHASRPDWIALDGELEKIEKLVATAAKEAEKIRRQEEERRRREERARERRYERRYSNSWGISRGSSSRGRSSRSRSRGGSSRRSGGGRRGGSSRR